MERKREIDGGESDVARPRVPAASLFFVARAKAVFPGIAPLIPDMIHVESGSSLEVVTPRKIRELKSDLRRAGFVQHPGKGSHTVWQHPRLANSLTLSGADGDDALPYQEKDVRLAIVATRRTQERE